MIQNKQQTVFASCAIENYIEILICEKECMVSRITEIKNVGKFIDAHIGARSFSPYTIIFGNNTNGKSTLTDIFRSLKLGNPSIIKGRKTFGQIGEQKIKIVFEGNKVIEYPSAQWMTGYEEIEIFDEDFITENIFQGEGVEFEHQKRLNQIIIGKQGKVLKDEIGLLQENSVALTQQKTSFTKEFNRAFGKFKANLEDFIQLKRINNVEERITSLKEKETFLKNIEQVKATLQKHIEYLSKLEFNSFKNLFSQNLSVNTIKITEHIDNTWSNKNFPRSFLEIGLKLTKADKKNCVFCGQQLNDFALELLQEYEKVFIGNYEMLKTEITQKGNKFIKWSPKTDLEKIQIECTNFNIDSKITQDYLNSIDSLKSTCDEEVSKKLENVNYAVNFSSFDQLEKLIQEILLCLKTIKQEKIDTSYETVAQIINESNLCEINKIRFTEEWEHFCKSHKEIEIKANEIREKRDDLREKLEKYSMEVFEQHQKTINKTLEKLGADFRIVNFTPLKKLVGQSERIFALEFFNRHTININETATEKSNFKNTLSSNDKRLLAFSFFISILKHDKNLHQKIVVFDDPFSSFDENRRRDTIHLLIDIESKWRNSNGEIEIKRPLQIIILTHEQNFFRDLYLKCPEAKPLKIVPDGKWDGKKKSTITDCNMEEFIESEIFLDLKELKEAQEANAEIDDFDKFSSKCRKILENIFKRKYYFDLRECIANKSSTRSFIIRLKELKINDYDTEEKFKEFDRLCDDLNIELHDNTIGNQGENARSILIDFLNLIKRI